MFISENDAHVTTSLRQTPSLKVDYPMFGDQIETSGSVNNKPTCVRQRNSRLVRSWLVSDVRRLDLRTSLGSSEMCRRTWGSQFLGVHQNLVFRRLQIGELYVGTLAYTRTRFNWPKSSKLMFIDNNTQFCQKNHH